MAAQQIKDISVSEMKSIIVRYKAKFVERINEAEIYKAKTAGFEIYLRFSHLRPNYVRMVLTQAKCIC